MEDGWVLVLGRVLKSSYRAGGDGVLDVEVEAKVDHVENSMAPQS